MTSQSAGIEIPVPEPVPTPAEMLARAHSLRERLRAGSYRAPQPRRFGGYEMEHREHQRTDGAASGMVAAAEGMG
jgi:hypothetical protein